MRILICAGMHSPELTEGFMAGLERSPEQFLVFPSAQYPVYSPAHVLDFMNSSTLRLAGSMPLILIGFSAGVVGAIGAARFWQRQGGTVLAFIAIDGWGVPLFGEFPIHRVSHDHFTHWSSALLGKGSDSFYADPPVEHLTLWHSPQSVLGYWIPSPHPKTTAAHFLTALIDRHTE